MKKILIVFGTRPEAIKMAPLIKEFRKYPGLFSTLVCVTSQHRELLDQVLKLFNIIPDYDLNIMTPNQDLYDITGKVLVGLRGIIEKSAPDLVVVQGDTTTTFAAALASYYQHIPVAHVEAGLRTNNINHPWPEELNRSLTSRIATWHFSPTTLAKQNLLAENIRENRIIITGNTAIDALHLALSMIGHDEWKEAKLNNLLKDAGYDIDRLQKHRRLILITGHRRENYCEGFQNICLAIRNLSLEHPDTDFVYPVHLNPNVSTPVYEILGDRSKNENVFLVKPLEYLPFIYLMTKSYLILTDSGGIQEEAPGLGKPVVLMRETTERPEALESGIMQLTGTNRKKIEQAVNSLLNDVSNLNYKSKATNPFGEGNASEKIVSFIRNLYK